MKPAPFIDIKELSVEFQTRNGVVRAIEDVTLQLAKGEVLGIVGESGLAEDVSRRPSDPYTQRLIEAIPHFAPAGAGRSEARF